MMEISTVFDRSGQLGRLCRLSLIRGCLRLKLGAVLD